MFRKTLKLLMIISLVALSHSKDTHAMRFMRDLITCVQTIGLVAKAQPLDAEHDVGPELKAFIRDTSERSETIAISGFTDSYVRYSGRLIDGTYQQTFVISRINSDHPGSKKYPALLSAIGGLLKQAGIKYIYVEQVHNPKQHEFYLRNGFKDATPPGTIGKAKSFYKEI